MGEKDSKAESSNEKSHIKGTAMRDDPKVFLEFRNPESWKSKRFDSKYLIASKQWYQQNYDRDESRSCPVCQDLSVDLANLLSCADTFKFATPIGALIRAFAGAYLAVLLKPDQSIIARTTIQIMTIAVIIITVLITLFVY